MPYNDEVAGGYFSRSGPHEARMMLNIKRGSTPGIEGRKKSVEGKAMTTERAGEGRNGFSKKATGEVTDEADRCGRTLAI